MHSLPSTSQIRAPAARSTKNGWPPTALKARTGELTPPGIRRRASANNCSERLPEVIGGLLLVEKGLRQRPSIGAHDRADPNFVSIKPSLFGFKNETDVFRICGNGSFVARFHVVNF